MLKSFFLTLVLFIASALLIAEATFASPLPQKTLLIAEDTVSSSSPQATQSKESSKIQVDVSNGNQQPADSETENLNTSARKAPVVAAPRSTYPQPPDPYDMDAIEKFNEELYGEGN